jgi:hypothetical protein
MNHFEKFCDIYCDKKYILKEEIYTPQKYESISDKSYYNYILKQKLIEKIYNSFKDFNEIPIHISKVFYDKSKVSKNFHKKTSSDISKMSVKNSKLKSILKILLKGATKNNISYLNVYEEIDLLDNINKFQDKDYEIIINTQNSVSRTRNEVLNYIRDNDILNGFFFILIWGGHKTPSISDTLIFLNENYQFTKELSSILCNASKSLKYTYNELAKVNGLGPAYFTKILYFYTHAYKKHWKTQSYIMDQFTSKSMNLIRQSEISKTINLSDDIIKINKNKTGETLDGKTCFVKYDNFNNDIIKITNFFRKNGNQNINEEIVEIMLFGEYKNKNKSFTFSPFKLWRQYVKENYWSNF